MGDEYLTPRDAALSPKKEDKLIESLRRHGKIELDMKIKTKPEDPPPSISDENDA